MGQSNFRKAPVEQSKYYQYCQNFNLQRIPRECVDLFHHLETIRIQLGFPAVTSDVGSLLGFISVIHQAKVIFEFGSGYGQSAFWFLSTNSRVKKIYLTEKMKTLQKTFDEITWPKKWLKKMSMHWGDAFECLEQVPEKIDLVLMDGQKRDYLRFLKKLEAKLNKNAVVIIDNALFKGSLLNPQLVKSKKSVQHLIELHEYLLGTDTWKVQLLALDDGLFLLQKNN